MYPTFNVFQLKKEGKVDQIFSIQLHAHRLFWYLFGRGNFPKLAAQALIVWLMFTRRKELLPRKIYNQKNKKSGISEAHGHKLRLI